METMVFAIALISELGLIIGFGIGAALLVEQLTHD
jgi:hypothetical protein